MTIWFDSSTEPRNPLIDSCGRVAACCHLEIAVHSVSFLIFDGFVVVINFTKKNCNLWNLSHTHILLISWWIGRGMFYVPEKEVKRGLIVEHVAFTRTLLHQNSCPLALSGMRSTLWSQWDLLPDITPLSFSLIDNETNDWWLLCFMSTSQWKLSERENKKSWWWDKYPSIDWPSPRLSLYHLWEGLALSAPLP